MADIIHTTSIKRESGYLYYVTSDKDNNLQIGKAPLSRGGKTATKKKLK